MIHQQVKTLDTKRLWHDLHHRLGNFFKEKLRILLESNEYKPHNINQRHVIAHVFITINQQRVRYNCYIMKIL